MYPVSHRIDRKSFGLPDAIFGVWQTVLQNSEELRRPFDAETEVKDGPTLHFFSKKLLNSDGGNALPVTIVQNYKIQNSVMLLWWGILIWKYFPCFVSIPGTVTIIFGLIRCAGDNGLPWYLNRITALNRRILNIWVSTVRPHGLIGKTQNECDGSD